VHRHWHRRCFRRAVLDAQRRGSVGCTDRPRARCRCLRAVSVLPDALVGRQCVTWRPTWQPATDVVSDPAHTVAEVRGGAIGQDEVTNFLCCMLATSAWRHAQEMHELRSAAST
jgi:hypothetical protein